MIQKAYSLFQRSALENVNGSPKQFSAGRDLRYEDGRTLVQFSNEIVDLPDREREDVATAFREILLNAIEHGGHREAQGLRPRGYGVLVATELVDELYYDEKGNNVADQVSE